MENTSRYSRIAKLLSMAALVLAVSPLVFAFLSPAFGDGTGILLSLIFPCTLAGTGYGLQALVCRITGFKRRDSVYEAGIKYVDKARVVIPVIAALGAYLLFLSLFREYRITLDGYIDPFALDLFAIPALGSVAMILGSVLWFYPYHKLLHVSMIYGYGAVFLAVAIITGVFSVTAVFHAVCFSLFVVIFFVVSNFHSIEEAITSANMRVPSNDFRSYNLYLTLKHCIVTFAAAVLLFSIVFLLSGLISFSPIESSGQKEEEEGEVIYELVEGEGIEQGKEMEHDTKVKEEGLSSIEIFCAFVVVIFFVGLAGYFLWRMHLFEKLFRLIIFCFNSIGTFAFSLISFFDRRRVEEDIPANYVDTESEIDCSFSFSPHRIIEELTRKSFEAKLKEKEDAKERFAYAYSVYCSLVQGERYGIKPSDTPRVITARLGVHRKNDLEFATPIYEEIRYRLKDPKQGTAEHELNGLVSAVKAMLD